jgi:hypothetical protein
MWIWNNLSTTRSKETLQLQLEYPIQSYAHQIAENLASPEFHEAVTKKKGIGGRPAHIIDKQQPHFPVLLTYTAKQCITLVSCVRPRPSSSKVHISPHFPQFTLTPLCPQYSVLLHKKLPKITYSESYPTSHPKHRHHIGTANKMNMMYSPCHEGPKLTQSTILIHSIARKHHQEGSPVNLS